MKSAKSITLLSFVLLALASPGVAVSQVARLSKEQQDKFLSERMTGNAFLGDFSSFGSLLAALGILVHTNDQEIAATELRPFFPEFYKPTTSEFLDAIAMQTNSSWSYDPRTGYWLFAKPAQPKPYSLTLSDKWLTSDRGIYVGYRPPTFPVGMDVYYYGKYSADNAKEQAALWERVRNSWALSFARYLNEKVTLEQMQKVAVDGAEALYFQSPTPKPGLVWRQWAFVKDGKTFVIVSTLPTDDKALFANVEAMVKSFRVTS
jgi:hypothetical protein